MHITSDGVLETPMNKAEYMAFHESCTKRMVEITRKKNSDYTGSGDDPFKNFRKRGTFGFLVRMDDKLARLESFLEKGSYEVQDESFEDTCLDLANYAILLCGYVKQTRLKSAISEAEIMVAQKMPPGSLTEAEIMALENPSKR